MEYLWFYVKRTGAICESTISWDRSYFPPTVASSNLLKESLIQFRNVTTVDVLEAVPLYGNGQRDVANGQRTANARSTQRSTHGQRNGSI